MIEELLAAPVAAVEAFDDAAEPDLFPVERAVIANVIGSRQREFGTVRRCARQALAQLGIPAVPLLPDAERTT